MQDNETESFCPGSRDDWRQWLYENHRRKQSVWLICYKKTSNIPSITYSDAVDEALCYGWIDSTRKSLDQERFTQFFCKRKSKSVWSKVNKAKVQKLIELGLMAEAGFASIEIAKQNGSWFILDEVEKLTIPPDLDKEFHRHRGSKEFFTGLSKSARKMMLLWLVLAKRPETRQKRILEIAEQAAKRLKPKQFS